MSAGEVDLTQWPVDEPIPLTPTRKQPARRRVKVIHYYMRHEARLAETVGILTPQLCGRAMKTTELKSPKRKVAVVGGLMVVPEKRDCRVCARILERMLRDGLALDDA